MVSKLGRRHFLACVSTSLAVTAGCSQELSSTSPSPSSSQPAGQLDESLIDTVEPETLQRTKLALRGYEIVSMKVGSRLVFLSNPALRILGVVLISSSVAAKLAVDYIDDELIRRRIEEEVSTSERSAIESQHAVEFQTGSGTIENVYLGPTQYANA